MHRKQTGVICKRNAPLKCKCHRSIRPVFQARSYLCAAPIKIAPSVRLSVRVEQLENIKPILLRPKLDGEFYENLSNHFNVNLNRKISKTTFHKSTNKLLFRAYLNMTTNGIHRGQLGYHRYHYYLGRGKPPKLSHRPSVNLTTQGPLTPDNSSAIRKRLVSNSGKRTIVVSLRYWHSLSSL